MSKRPNILIYLLAFYVVLQFLWWGYQILDLGALVDSSDEQTSRRVFMILGEGFVFILILMAGFWQIQKAIKKEIELSQNQNNFMLSITHELKTPLTAIQLALQTLSSRKLSELQKQELLENASAENERLKILIDNIINASRIENKGLSTDKTNIDMKVVIEGIAKAFKKRHEDKTIQLEADESILVFMDVFMIETSINNIMENAIKYGGNDVIKIRLTSKDKYCLISILDQGPGIDESNQYSIFDKFYRIGNEETRSKKGSGLGLYIAKQFVQLHGGDIIYQKNEPVGSIFTISLPYGK
jgi:K+-sensing histidine kinase KdpD